MIWLLPCISIAITLYQHGHGISEDGRFYLALSAGQAVPSPYRLRWLLPRILADRIHWQMASWSSLILSCPALAWYLRQHGLPEEIGVAIWVSLPIFRQAIVLPVLVDGVALLGSLLVAIAPWPLAIVGSIVLGCVSERAPVFAALWGWSPAPLAGLVAPAIGHLALPRGNIPEWARPWLARPIASARERHRADWDSLRVLVAPWGALVLAAIGRPDLQLVATVAVAYAQLFVACDRVRLYQWAAPVVMLRALPRIPAGWGIAAAIATWVNPWGRVQL